MKVSRDISRHSLRYFVHNLAHGPATRVVFDTVLGTLATTEHASMARQMMFPKTSSRAPSIPYCAEARRSYSRSHKAAQGGQPTMHSLGRVCGDSFELPSVQFRTHSIFSIWAGSFRNLFRDTLLQTSS